jgi:integrase-like protein
VWKILRKLGYILDAPERKRQPLELRDPLEEVQMDFKDATTVPADPDGKRQHVVEVLNFVDAGTSILLSAQAHADFHAETALEAVVQFLRQYGLPAMLTFDHDPRWVGSSSGRDFPSALRRLLLCLGIVPNVIPPEPPQKNPYVERYHRTYNQECLQVHRPATLSQVREVTAAVSARTTTRSDHTRGARAATNPLASRFPCCRDCLLCPRRSTPMRGSTRSKGRRSRGESALMAA